MWASTIVGIVIHDDWNRDAVRPDLCQDDPTRKLMAVKPACGRAVLIEMAQRCFSSLSLSPPLQMVSIHAPAWGATETLRTGVALL